MNNKYYNVIATMSGTSLDGIDIICLRISRDGDWNFRILAASTYPYDNDWLKKLSSVSSLEMGAIGHLDNSYTELHADYVLRFMKEHQISNHRVDFLCSHGHTVYHQPLKGLTLQIGNKPLLAQRTGLKAIVDFRSQDVFLGGQGAPLVPIGDRLLFSKYGACVNLGGFSNISFEGDKGRIAYDICPVNIVLNNYARELGCDYDRGGAFAKAGIVHEKVLQKLNDLSYYHTPYPKSLGVEWVQEFVFPILGEISGVNNVLATFTEHAAVQIAENISDKGTVLMTGGGVYNNHFVSRIKAYSNVEIVIPDSQIVEFKEALIFGLLGVLKSLNEVNVLASVTGAKYDHCSGVLITP